MGDLKDELNRRDAIKVSDNDFEFFKLDTPEEFLSFCVNNGYLLHGSTRKISGVLTPQQANDTSKEFGNKTGVYLTTTPIIAMFTALTGGAEVGIRRNSVISKIDSDGNISYPETKFAVLHTNNVKPFGYVYIFPKGVADEHEASEYISKKAIQPILTVKIEKEDFRFPIEKIKEK